MLRGISGVRSISASPVRGDLRVARLSARTEGVLERARARSTPPPSSPRPVLVNRRLADPGEESRRYLIARSG